MTTFWCPWCGDMALADSPDALVPCMPCAREFLRLFGFRPRTDMVPLSPGEEPGEPAASRKQFTFVDVRTGRVAGRTEIARRKSACEGESSSYRPVA